MSDLCRFGVSRALYEEFLRPLLLVGLFAPPEELSAAAVLGTFYFYSAHLLTAHAISWASHAFCTASLCERHYNTACVPSCAPEGKSCQENPTQYARPSSTSYRWTQSLRACSLCSAGAPE